MWCIVLWHLTSKNKIESNEKEVDKGRNPWSCPYLKGRWQPIKPNYFNGGPLSSLYAEG